jgi:hypothetical protein
LRGTPRQLRRYDGSELIGDKEHAACVQEEERVCSAAVLVEDDEAGRSQLRGSAPTVAAFSRTGTQWPPGTSPGFRSVVSASVIDPV